LFTLSLRSALEAAALSLSLSLDVFVAFFLYGSRGIRVPKTSIFVAGFVCTAIFTLFAAFGQALRPFFPEKLAAAIGSAALLLLGCSRVFDYAVKSAIRKGAKKLKFKARGILFMLEIYADPDLADLDSGGELSTREAALVALVMSIDGAAGGFGAGSSGAQVILCSLFSALMCLLAIIVGRRLGEYLTGRTMTDLSPAGGALLIALSIVNLVR
jgi:putative sporulation protein YtaF